MAIFSIALGIFSVAILPVVNNMPVDFSKFFTEESSGLGSFFLLYMILAIPFFIAGIIFSTVFSAWPEKIRQLYFWDLSGAALGSVILIPLLPLVSPGGILVILLGLSLVAGGIFHGGKVLLRLAIISGAAIIITAFAMPDDVMEFKEHIGKRYLKAYRQLGKVEYKKWDPTSKIDVVNHNGSLRIIFYDGGLQSSEIVEFDGDIEKLSRELPGNYARHFTVKRRLVSHALK